jgi:hypothetical protein
MEDLDAVRQEMGICMEPMSWATYSWPPRFIANIGIAARLAVTFVGLLHQAHAAVQEHAFADAGPGALSERLAEPKIYRSESDLLVLLASEPTVHIISFTKLCGVNAQFCPSGK